MPEFHEQLDFHLCNLIIVNSWHLTEKKVYMLAISEYKKKLECSIKWGGYLAGGELNLVDDAGKESKYDAEYNYLKSIGAL